jgi:hypothetical protein
MTAMPITALVVQGFKSLARPEPYEIEVRPLTLLAGANSSGKSSAVQPLLLLKQTLEANYDPGPLLLNGPHVRFTSAAQILPRVSKGSEDSGPAWFHAGLAVGGAAKLVSGFTAWPEDDDRFQLEKMEVWKEDRSSIVFPGASAEEFARFFDIPPDRFDSSPLQVQHFRHRCFFDAGIGPHGLTEMQTPRLRFVREIVRVLHVPGLRGNPARSYPTTATGPVFPGTFEPYVASLVHGWQQSNPETLRTLCDHLARLGLTWKVEAKRLDATQVELQVGRLPHARRGGARDLVNIADVGFGVSQTLPVVVALLAAKEGQLVYLEQPEIHLHPKAQIALAGLLADAAKRGVRLLVETHSALLLLAVQALVAEGGLPKERVLLHWFQRNGEGVTEITAAELDEQGAYGEWPEDFGETQLAAQSRYMDAVEKHLFHAG